MGEDTIVEMCGASLEDSAASLLDATKQKQLRPQNLLGPSQKVDSLPLFLQEGSRKNVVEGPRTEGVRLRRRPNKR